MHRLGKFCPTMQGIYDIAKNVNDVSAKPTENSTRETYKQAGDTIIKDIAHRHKISGRSISRYHNAWQSQAD